MSIVDIVSLVVVFAALVLAVYSVFIEPYRIQVNRVEIPVRDLPESLDGLTICHLSDTHISRYGRLERKLGGLLSGLEMDLCVITGDLINSLEGSDSLKRVLSGIRPEYGVYAVPGNGDYKLGVPVSDVAAILEKVGINTLLNNHVCILSNGCKLSIMGVEDPFLGKDDLLRSMSGIPDDGIRILLAHSPDILMKLNDERIDLILAGHTHGGQIRFPFLGALWLHCRHRLGISHGYLGPKELTRISGRSVTDSRMYVSRGTGFGTIPVRFLCRPEVALLVLRMFRE